MLSTHYLSVGCLFKNESHSIREWIQHYLSRGVDHLYLIDDDSVAKIQGYIDSKKVALFDVCI